MVAGVPLKDVRVNGLCLNAMNLRADVGTIERSLQAIDTGTTIDIKERVRVMQGLRSVTAIALDTAQTLLTTVGIQECSLAMVASRRTELVVLFTLQLVLNALAIRSITD
jgi:hypothetical protein